VLGADDPGAEKRVQGVPVFVPVLDQAARVVVPGSRSQAHGVEGVALSPDGKVLYACSRRPATPAGYHYSAVLAAYHAASGR